MQRSFEKYRSAEWHTICIAQLMFESFDFPFKAFLQFYCYGLPVFWLTDMNLLHSKNRRHVERG